MRERFTEEANALETIRERADTIARRHRELREWCGWWRRRTEAIDLGLTPFVRAIEDGHVPVDEIEATFEAAYCDWWSGAVIGEDEVLRTFSTPEHVATIDDFREIDDRFQKLTSAYVGAKLAGLTPDSDSVTRKSSWGILRHEIQKKRQHKPVRQLLADIPDVMTTLAPCLMMSPLSVAQYLAADQALFDVVIFDEASQITVWDAIGCLARGRQAIVVGDPKQMPPTNFFARTDDDPDDDIDMEGDLESILDELLGASIPERTAQFALPVAEGEPDRLLQQSLLQRSADHLPRTRLAGQWRSADTPRRRLLSGEGSDQSGGSEGDCRGNPPPAESPRRVRTRSVHRRGDLQLRAANTDRRPLG